MLFVRLYVLISVNKTKIESNYLKFCLPKPANFSYLNKELYVMSIKPNLKDGDALL